MRTFELLFERARQIPLPDPARAHIAVASHAVDAAGRLLISPECRTADEVDHWASCLIKELEELKLTARRAFEKERLDGQR